MSEYRGDDFYCDRVLNGLESIKIELETERVLVYHHTRPTWDFHLVIVPKAHIANLCEVKDPALFAEIFNLITNVVVRYGLNGTAYRIVTNGGSFQDSKHLHFHLLAGEKKLAKNSVNA